MAIAYWRDIDVAANITNMGFFYLPKTAIHYFDNAFRSPQVVANLPFGSTAKNAEFSPR